MSIHALTTEDLGSSAQRERRERILDATITLASQGGFDAVQMRAVADRADVALGTLYRYFPSKIHLLVTALAREFERTEAALADSRIEGDTPADRVVTVLRWTTSGLEDDPHLTEALTRAFMFADRSVATEIRLVARLLTRIVTHAMHPDRDEVDDEDVAIARVVGDVWLASLVGCVTGRSTTAETVAHMERAVRLIVR
ncbi:TetR family transcriptional regulator [Nocardioides sp.]|uniref:TetR family transcriptional regulator n=1 Tax=Nocardioides sp. TaxID=35761 RepID=UPI002D098D87|nr:TetR family transcriptional regulator [Nocardioides sp.]HXH78519.1 TetR family transcriptional regulator [Nocardioides sp.]